ncbi:MAG: hypothetical protein PHC97_00530 [Patescibacteria group bacterium]|nr:hypothetical protein [Patescibacteria group bacterium]
MKKLVLLAALLVISTCLLEAKNSDRHSFTNKKSGYALSCPDGWTMAYEEQINLLSLYSPDAKKHPNDTLDLERGLKIELTPMKNAADFDEIIKPKDDSGQTCSYKPRSILILGKEKVQIYACDDGETLFLAALRQDGKKFIAAFGYVPEKDKWNFYTDEFAKTLSRLKFIETSGSK